MSRLDWCQRVLLHRDCYDWKNDNCDNCNIFKAYIEGARAAKAEPVRCKDCKNRARYATCDFLGEDGFCSYGERREEAEA